MPKDHRSRLQAKMLRVSRDVKASSGELVATDGDGQVLRIMPFSGKGTVDEVFGHIEGKPIYCEDIDTPTKDEWAGLR